MSSPQHVTVYGNDHSPWVQAVLLGLHEKGIAHTNVTVPPLGVFLESGILMPAARIDDGPWRLDSERILVALGFSEVREEERRALFRLFGGSAMERTESAWSFWQRFSRVRDGHPRRLRRLWHQLLRPFSMLYFFTLITAGRRMRPRVSCERQTRELASWQERLSPGKRFFGGATPDTVDLQLFGLVQMFASIPGQSLAVLRDEPGLARLREWIGAMQERFAGYPHLYTARIFEPPAAGVAPADLPERGFYWLGAALVWLALPLTLPAVFYFVRRVRRKGLVRT